MPVAAADDLMKKLEALQQLYPELSIAEMQALAESRERFLVVEPGHLAKLGVARGDLLGVPGGETHASRAALARAVARGASRWCPSSAAASATSSACDPGSLGLLSGRLALERGRIGDHHVDGARRKLVADPADAAFDERAVGRLVVGTQPAGDVAARVGIDVQQLDRLSA